MCGTECWWTDTASLCRPPSLTLRWELPEADSAHAEAACHEIEAVAISEAGAAHSSHSKASSRATQQEVRGVKPGLTYEVGGIPHTVLQCWYSATRSYVSLDSTSIGGMPACICTIGHLNHCALSIAPLSASYAHQVEIHVK